MHCLGDKMNVLTNYFEIRNSNDGKYIQLQVDGKFKKFKTLSDVAEAAFNKSQTIFADDQYLTSDSKKEIDKLRTEQNYSLQQAFCAQFEKELAQYLTHKKEARDNYIQNALPSAFNAKFIPASFKPASFCNSVDLSFINSVVYCVEQDALYYTSNNSYKLIGTIDEIISKDSRSIYTLATCINKDLSIKYNIDCFDFWSYLYQQVDRATEAFFEAKVLLETVAQSGATVNVEEKLNCVPWSEKISLNYFSDKSGKLVSDWYDRLHSYFIKSIFTYLIPASGVNNDLYNVYYETLNDDSGTFKRYAIKPTHGAKCTFETYLSKLFSERFVICSTLKKIDAVPHIISDDSTIAEFSYDSNWKNKLANQVDFKDAKILNAFIKPYTKEERIALMAWAYTVIHPSTNDNIHLLFMTGGGTFKTNYYCTMIEKILKLAYSSKRSLVHQMKEDRWITDSFLRESTTTGISNSAMVNADECTDKCLEQFKSMSGGTNDGMSYQKRMMRETPISMRIYCKWLFTTNKFFSIEDDSGAFDRRLLIINRMDVKNIEKPYSAAEFSKHIDSEICAFYDLAKTAYDAMLKVAPTLQEYRDATELKKNMTLAYNEEDKLMLYYEVYDALNSSSVNHKYVKKCMVVPREEFNDVVEERCKIAGVNFSGFKKWILNTSDTEYTCEYKTVHRDNKYEKCWCLSQLKQDVIDNIIAQADKAEDVPGVNVSVSIVKKTPLTDEEIIDKSATKSKIFEALEHEDPEIKNAVWAMLKKENTDPNSLSRVQIQAYIDDAHEKRLKKVKAESCEDDFISHLAV